MVSVQHTATSFDTRFQAFTPSVAWGTLVLFCGYLAGYVLVFGLVMANALPYPLASLALAVLAFIGFTIAHDAGHGAIFAMGSRFKWLESVMGWVASVPLLLVPYRLFQKIHDRHHAFTNDPDRDPDHFSIGPQWYKVVLNSLVIPFQYHRLAFTTYRHDPQIRATYLSSAMYFCLIISTLAGLVYLGYVIEVLVLSVVPVVLAVIALALFFDYIPHYPHKMLDRFHNTRIYPSKLLNALLLGQNYHLVHHLYPRVPWYHYRSVFLDIQDDLKRQQAPIEALKTHAGLLRSPFANQLTLENGMLYRLLTVQNIDRISNNAVAITFERPAAQPFHFQAGQFVTVSKFLSGRQVTRAYSLCTSPLTLPNALPQAGEITIAVQRQPGGAMSNYLHDQLSVGDELIVQGPFGQFTLPKMAAAPHTPLIFYAAGSGITPIKSMLESALIQRTGPIGLLYVCRSEAEAMFLLELRALVERHPAHIRMRVHFTRALKQGNQSKQRQPFTDKQMSEFLEQISADISLKKSAHFVCGPAAFQTRVFDALADAHVSENRIHSESFVPTKHAPSHTRYRVAVEFAGQTYDLQVASNQSILDVAVAEGVAVPHACGQGLCGSCKCKIESGKIAAQTRAMVGLSRQEVRAGFTLACQAYPQDDLSVRF